MYLDSRVAQLALVSIFWTAKMVGVLGLAILGLLAYATLKTARSFLLNLERAKKMGLPYVIGRELLYLGCVNGSALRDVLGGKGWLHGDPSQHTDELQPSPL